MSVMESRDTVRGIGVSKPQRMHFIYFVNGFGTNRYKIATMAELCQANLDHHQRDVSYGGCVIRLRHKFPAFYQQIQAIRHYIKSCVLQKN